MGGITNQRQLNFQQEIKLAIQYKLKSLAKPMVWMTARGLTNYLASLDFTAKHGNENIMSSLLVEQLLYELEQNGNGSIRRSVLPGKKNLGVLWGHTGNVGDRNVLPVEKNTIADNFFNTEGFKADENTKKCFISHSHKDVSDVIEIGKKLLGFNVYPWMAETDIKINQAINYEIQLAIKSADYFLIYVTENSIQSVWTEKELAVAQGLTRLVVANKKGFKTIIKNANRPLASIDPFYLNDQERLKIDDESVNIFLSIINNEVQNKNQIGMIQPLSWTNPSDVKHYNLIGVDQYFANFFGA